MCKAGGTSMGYHMSGFHVIGVDIEPQKRYPFEFIQMDALSISPSFIFDHFHVVAASPPCQLYSVTRGINPHIDYPDLVEPTRDLLQETGLPYCMENVVRAPLQYPVQLCGSSFGLRVRRHRWFESNVSIVGSKCDHSWQKRHMPYHTSKGQPTGVVGVFGGGQNLGEGEYIKWQVAMGIDWMSKREMAQAIPPAYTLHLGKQIYASLS